MMEFYHQGQHQSWRAPRLITKWLDDWLPKYSGVCKYAAQWGHQCSLMNRPQWGRCGWWSLHNPKQKCEKGWHYGHGPPPKKGRPQKRELWEEMQRWMQTQTYIQWHGCAIINIVTTMKWLASGRCFTHWQMEEEPWCDALHATCYQHGNGPPPHIPHPALPLQPTWRLDDGCL